MVEAGGGVPAARELSVAHGAVIGLSGKSFSCGHLDQLATMPGGFPAGSPGDPNERLRLMRQSMHAAKRQGIQLGISDRARHLHQHPVPHEHEHEDGRALG